MAYGSCSPPSGRNSGQNLEASQSTNPLYRDIPLEAEDAGQVLPSSVKRAVGRRASARVRRVDVGGLMMSPLDLSGSLARLEALLQDGQQHYVAFCDSNLFVHVRENPDILPIINGASMVLADGVALVLLSKLLRRPLPARVPGPAFIDAACEFGLSRGWRHFFYGGAEDVAPRLADALQRKYPGLRVAGTYTPPFRALDEAEERQVKARIEEAQPHLLWVGLGGPKQELWMAGHMGRIDVPVMLGVGAAFDFHSGNRRWAPVWVRKAGMEWAYRALTGGKRVFWRNLRCVPMAAMLIAGDVSRAAIGREDQ